jgi:hypothetical protein
MVRPQVGHVRKTPAAGASPHAPVAAFRDLGNHVDLDDFTHRLREGLTSGHPDMPTSRFTGEDARADGSTVPEVSAILDQPVRAIGARLIQVKADGPCAS